MWFCWKFTALCSSERILKIDQELTKLRPWWGWHPFFWITVYNDCGRARALGGPAALACPWNRPSAVAIKNMLLIVFVHYTYCLLFNFKLTYCLFATNGWRNDISSINLVRFDRFPADPVLFASFSDFSILDSWSLNVFNLFLHLLTVMKHKTRVTHCISRWCEEAILGIKMYVSQQNEEKIT